MDIRLQKVINFFKEDAPTMSMSGGGIAGSAEAGDDPPVNKSRKSRFRSAIKKMNLIIDKKDKKEALAFLPKLNSELMKIAKTGVIKKQNASRNISRITKKINSL